MKNSNVDNSRVREKGEGAATCWELNLSTNHISLPKCKGRLKLSNNVWGRVCVYTQHQLNKSTWTNWHRNKHVSVTSNLCAFNLSHILTNGQNTESPPWKEWTAIFQRRAHTICSQNNIVPLHTKNMPCWSLPTPAGFWIMTHYISQKPLVRPKDTNKTCWHASLPLLSIGMVLKHIEQTGYYKDI